MNCSECGAHFEGQPPATLALLIADYTKPPDANDALCQLCVAKFVRIGREATALDEWDIVEAIRKADGVHMALVAGRYFVGCLPGSHGTWQDAIAAADGEDGTD